MIVRRLSTSFYVKWLCLLCFFGKIVSLKSEFSSPYLAFTDARGIKSLNLTSLDTQNLYSDGHHIFDIDFLWNETEPQLFWSDYESGKIYSALVHDDELENVQVVVDYSITSVEGIAVDWIAQNLYWVESQYGWIEMININSSLRCVVVTNIESPRAIALDSRDGWLFWTNWNAKSARVERSTMSGENRITIVDINDLPNGGFPNGLTIDYNSRRIYWIDAKSNSIYSANYDGQQGESVLLDHSAIQSPYGLAILNGDLFWVDAKLYTVNKVNVYNTSSVEILYESYWSLYGVTVIHPSRHPQVGNNPCKDNFGCSHLCVPDLNSKAVCLCPHLMVIGNDGKTCQKAEDILLVSEFHKEGNEGFDVIFGLSLNSSTQPITLPIVLPIHTDIIGLELDALAEFVYWADSNSHAIWRASVMDSITEKVLSVGYSKITGFGADWENGQLFYSTVGLQQGIHSCSMVNYNCTKILQTRGEPHSLKLHSMLKRLFWVEHSNRKYFINSADLNGSNNNTVFEELVTNKSTSLNGFTVDSVDGALYWVSSERNGIVKLHSSGEQSVFKMPFTLDDINAVVIEGDSILIGDRIGKIFTLNKHTGNYLGIVYNSSGTINVLQQAKLNRVSSGNRSCEVNNGGCDGQCSVSFDGTISCLPLYSPGYYTQDLPIKEIGEFLNGSYANGDDKNCPLTCFNSGQCLLNKWGEPFCYCHLGYHGSDCQFNVCDNYCKRGECAVKIDGRPSCNCETGYFGVKCQYSLCSEFCLNGDCEMMKGRPVCKCFDGWTGKICQQRFQEMKKTPVLLNVCKFYCLNDGVCVAPHHENALPLCRCPSGYSGSRCEVHVVAKAIQIITFALLTCALLLGLAFIAAYSIKKGKLGKLTAAAILRPLSKRQNCNFHETVVHKPILHEEVNAFCLNHSPASDRPLEYIHSPLPQSRKYDDCITLLSHDDQEIA